MSNILISIIITIGGKNILLYYISPSYCKIILENITPKDNVRIVPPLPIEINGWTNKLLNLNADDKLIPRTFSNKFYYPLNRSIHYFSRTGKAQLI